MALTKFVLIGGTERALKTLQEILKLDNPEIQISLCIFMPGYDDELESCKKLEELAISYNLPYIIEDVISQEIIKKLKNISPHVMLGLGIWRSMISDEVLRIPEFGYIGLHGTPLPRLRGFAGIYWQIINGYDAIKTRFYRLDPGIDSGPYVCDVEGRVLEYSIPIGDEKHLKEILLDYDSMHIKANLDIITKIVDRKFSFKEQPEIEATYACHRGQDDGEINWNLSTKEVFNFIRAQSDPCPGAYTYFNDKKISIWRAKPRYDYSNYEGRIPGKVVSRLEDSGSVIILTSDGGIEILDISVEGKSGAILPVIAFNSIRKKCQTSIEAKVNILYKKLCEK